MRANELPNWLELAKSQSAVRVRVRRARRGTGSAAQVFVEEVLVDLDVDRLLERMREDVIARRLPIAAFDLEAIRDGEAVVMRDRVQVSRDDVTLETTTPEDIEATMPALLRLSIASGENAHRALREMCIQTLQEVRGMLAEANKTIVDAEARRAEVLSAAFDMAQMKSEREEAARASSERRELAGKAIEEIVPIVGAGMSHIVKNATPAWGALFTSLQKSGNIEAVLAAMTPEQKALVSEAIGFTFPDKKSDKKAAAADAPKQEAPEAKQEAPSDGA